jgi:BMFP domain-containing protein YqiC
MTKVQSNMRLPTQDEAEALAQDFPETVKRLEPSLVTAGLREATTIVRERLATVHAHAFDVQAPEIVRACTELKRVADMLEARVAELEKAPLVEPAPRKGRS